MFVGRRSNNNSRFNKIDRQREREKKKMNKKLRKREGDSLATRRMHVQIETGMRYFKREPKVL